MLLEFQEFSEHAVSELLLEFKLFLVSDPADPAAAVRVIVLFAFAVVVFILVFFVVIVVR